MRASEIFETLNKLVEDSEYFETLVTGDDPNTFALQMDETEGTAFVGCLLLPERQMARTGEPSLSFELFWVRRRGEDMTADEWSEARDELSEQIDCFCRQLRPYVWQLPTTFERFDDMALAGFWASFTAVANLVCCGQPTPPPPPPPTGEYYDYMECLNGVNNTNYFTFYFDKPTVRRFELQVFSFTSNPASTAQMDWQRNVIIQAKQSTTEYSWQQARAIQTAGLMPCYIIYDFETLTIRFEGKDRNVLYTQSLSILHQWAAYPTDVVWGRFFSQRNAINNCRQRNGVFRVWEAGMLVNVFRPWKRYSDGAVGYKCELTGEELYPQDNQTITVGNL